MKHESIGIPLGLGQKVEVLTLPKSVPKWTGDRIQTNAKGQMRTNFVENEEAAGVGRGAASFSGWKLENRAPDFVAYLYLHSVLRGAVVQSAFKDGGTHACVTGTDLVRTFVTNIEAMDWVESEVS